MFWWVPLIAGLEDGLNPCALMTCAGMLAMRNWLQQRGISAGKAVAVFCLSVFLSDVAVNIFLFKSFLATQDFQKSVVVGYWILAVLFLSLAGNRLWEWSRGTVAVPLGLKPATKGIFLGAIAGAVLMSEAGSIWPPNYYIGILSNNLLLPGQFAGTVMPLTAYYVARLWLVVLLAVLFRSGILSLRIQQVVSAAILVSAAGGIIYTFLA